MSSTKDRSKSSRRCRRNCKDAPANRKIPIRSKVSPGPPGPLPVSADGPATKANDLQDRSPCATDCSALMPSSKAISSKQMCAHASPQGEREKATSRLTRIEPLFKAFPAIRIIFLQRRGFCRVRGDTLRVPRLEHEGHGARQLDRLQFRIAAGQADGHHGLHVRDAVPAAYHHARGKILDAAGRLCGLLERP